MATLITQTWSFKALDSWFFRESRPMESIGGSELLSAFPPSPRTLAGAIRTVVGETRGVDWQKWKNKNEYLQLKARIGDHESFGQLSISGAWLAHKNQTGQKERLFPVPRNLIALQEGRRAKDRKILRMQVGKPRHCHLGQKVRMAISPESDSKPNYLDDYWVNAQTLASILAGHTCQPENFIPTSKLFEREARLGIARDNLSRSVQTGLLYQTRHVRPKPSVSLETDVRGLLRNDYVNKGIIHLGGEGRGAAFEVNKSHMDPMPKTVQATDNTHGILLVLLTPSRASLFDKNKKYSPLPGFAYIYQEQSKESIWKGNLHGIKLTLHCAIQGKPVREGGWNLANNQPREVQSLVPGGSVYYLTVDDGNIQHAIDNLHLKQLPGSKEDIALGRGLLAVGLWPKNELITEE